MPNTPLVSVIIPCYNHGQFIREAIASVEKCDPNSYELIIVNDGSTDPETCTVFRQLQASGYHVISQTNQGLAAARNNGIRAAKGRYILPLDADNRIRPNYISEGARILNATSEISVVYGRPHMFGEVNGSDSEKAGEFDLLRLLEKNFIDACALFRKSLWEECGGYDRNLPGLEDWDFWLSAVAKGHKFFFLDETTFDYRVRSESMIRTLGADQAIYNAVINYVVRKHPIMQAYKASDGLRIRVDELESRVRSLEILERKVQGHPAFKIYHRLKYFGRSVH